MLGLWLDAILHKLGSLGDAAGGGGVDNQGDCLGGHYAGVESEGGAVGNADVAEDVVDAHEPCRARRTVACRRKQASKYYKPEVARNIFLL